MSFWAKMDIPVIIVGGGPVGLACSLFLSRFQISHLLVEKHSGTSRHPKAMGLQARTMEIFRGLGLAEELESRALPEDWTHNTFWCTTLFGEILRQVPLLSAEQESVRATLTPVRPLHCPQTATEEVLLKYALRSAFFDCRFNHELTGFEQSGEGVTARIVHRESGEQITVNAQYMIGADGAHGTIREQLGVERLGPPDMGHFANIHFRANVGPRLADRKGIIYNCLSTEDFGSVVAINGTNDWLLHHFLMPGETMDLYTPEYTRALVARIAGLEEAEVEILAVSPWVMSAQISQEFRSGRVFLAGDAAHRTTPVGGLGLNTGIQSAHNLTWKLGSVLRGWCDPSLLDTYDEERRPIVLSNIEASKSKAGGIFPIVEAACSGKWDEAVAKIQELPPARNELERDLGYCYQSGAFSGASEEVPVGTASVGRRAPHRWLEEGKSTLDLFGRSFVFLTASPEGKAFGERLQQEGNADALQIVSIPEEVLLEGFGCAEGGAVLVRPDGFVGWKAQSVPQEASAILASLKILKT